MTKKTGSGQKRQRSRANETVVLSDDGMADRSVERRTKQKLDVRGGAKGKGQVADVGGSASAKGKGKLRKTQLQMQRDLR